MSEDEILVQYVFENDCIYNLHSKDYKDIRKKQNVWISIGEKMKLSAEQCEKRWKLLREKFCRQRNGLKGRKPAGSGAENVTIWELYESMLFLEPYVKNRKRTNNLNNSKITEEKQFSDDDYENSEKTDPVDLELRLSPSPALSLQSPDLSYKATDREEAPVTENSETPSPSLNSVVDKKFKKRKISNHNSSVAETSFLKSLEDYSRTMHSYLQRGNTDQQLSFNQHYAMHLAARLDNLLPYQQDFIKFEVEKAFMQLPYVAPPPTIQQSALIPQTIVSQAQESQTAMGSFISMSTNF